MATATLDKLSDVQTQIIEYIERVQSSIVDGVKTVVEFIDERLPELPELPYTENLPTAKDLVSNQFAFADKVLKSNKKFVVGVVDGIKPLESQIRKSAPAPKAKKAA